MESDLAKKPNPIEVRISERKSKDDPVEINVDVYQTRLDDDHDVKVNIDNIVSIGIEESNVTNS